MVNKCMTNESPERIMFIIENRTYPVRLKKCNFPGPPRCKNL